MSKYRLFITGWGLHESQYGLDKSFALPPEGRCDLDILLERQFDAGGGNYLRFSELSFSNGESHHDLLSIGRMGRLEVCSYRPDDFHFAMRTADTFNALISLTYDAGESEQQVLAIPVEAFHRDVVDWPTTRDGNVLLPDRRWVDDGVLISLLRSHRWTSTEAVINALQLVAATLSEERFVMGIQYFHQALFDGYFSGGDIPMVLDAIENAPLGPTETARAERCMHSTFKALESVIGEPPKDERKLRRKLLLSGVDPDAMVGWEYHGRGPERETLLTKVRRLHHLRDALSAHALTPERRPLKYYELMDLQECARFVLLSAIQRKAREIEPLEPS